MQDRRVTDRSIDHGVVKGPVRPFDMEVLLDKIGAFSINRIHKLFRFVLTLAASQQTPPFIFSRSVKKQTERVLAIPQKML